MNKIKLTILTPNKVIKNTTVYRVIIPAFEGPLTVIEDHAPLNVILTEGLIQILNEHNQVIEKFPIKTGIADIAQNTCTLAVEEITIK